MTAQDRYSAGDFAKRYKMRETDLERLCKRFGIDAETVLSRDEFRKLLEADKDESSAQATTEGTNTPPPKEEPVPEKKNEKKVAFSRLAAEHRLSRPRIAALKVCTGWGDETKITEPELKAAVLKHLKNKE
ncbi:hypothetical protein JXM67_15395 [candidate division WOR-3 bacterium]|nr:hypothetical protein [candidate division WOR-3 bacterium]